MESVRPFCTLVLPRPEALDELRIAVGSEDDEDVTLANWNGFHGRWLSATSMASHLGGVAAEKRRKVDDAKATAAQAEKEQAMQRDFEQRLEKVTQEAAIKGLATPKLLAADVLKEQKKRGAYFEQRESAARAAAAYRSLAPEKWAEVREDRASKDDGASLALERE